MSRKEHKRKTEMTRSENINLALKYLDGYVDIKRDLKDAMKKAHSSHHAPRLHYATLSNLLNAARYASIAMIQQGMDPNYCSMKEMFTINGNIIMKRKDTPENLKKLIEQIDELV